MEWRFTTPKAPHQTGCAEAMVKTCREALKKVLGDQTLTPLELYTYLLESANLVNQRPVGRAPNDPDDGSYLCPNDILLGRATLEVLQAEKFFGITLRLGYQALIFITYWNNIEFNLISAFLVPATKHVNIKRTKFAFPAKYLNFTTAV